MKSEAGSLDNHSYCIQQKQSQNQVVFDKRIMQMVIQYNKKPLKFPTLSLLSSPLASSLQTIQFLSINSINL